MAKSTKSLRSGNSQMPYDGFPLLPQAGGPWAKKPGGNLRYFGRWADRQKGRRPSPCSN